MLRFLPDFQQENLHWARNVALAGEVCVLGWLIMTEGIAAPAWILAVTVGAVTLIVAAASHWPIGAISLLIAASALPRLSITLLGLHLRPEHVAVGTVLLIVCFKLLSRQAFRLKHLLHCDYFLIAYIVLNFITSAFTSPAPRMTLRWAALNAIVIMPFFLIRYLVTQRSKAYRAMDVFLLVGAAEALIGIVCFLSNAVFRTTLGVTADQYGAIPGTYGTQYEANIFGSYTACCSIVFLTYFLLNRGGHRNRYLWGLSVSVIAAMISLARAVLVALPVAAAFVLWTTYRAGQVKFRSMVRLTLVLALALLAISPFIVNFVSQRFGTLDFAELSSDSSTVTRIVQLGAGLEDVRQHPILGTGTASFQLFFNWDDYMPGMGGNNGEGGWLGNSPLRILHDTGLVGLLLFLSFIGSLAVAARNTYKTANQEIRTAIIALSAGLILYAITFQATEATMLAFTWVHFGLLAAIVHIERFRPSSPCDSR
ncbi:MAG: O-antigen ligase family protein [Terriglobales bacterium]